MAKRGGGGGGGLLVGEDKQGGARQLFLFQKRLQLLGRLVEAPLVCRVDHVHDGIGVGVVVLPIYGRICFCPPMSHTLSLKPCCCTDLMLKPCVGVIELMSSPASDFSAVVLPELSRPSIRSRIS